MRFHFLQSYFQFDLRPEVDKRMLKLLTKYVTTL